MLEPDARPPPRPRFGPHGRFGADGDSAVCRHPAVDAAAAAVRTSSARPLGRGQPTGAGSVSRPERHGEPERATTGPAEFDVARTPRSVALVRRYCVDACCELGWVESADAVELLVSELATNCVVHACGSRMRVRVRVLDHGMRLRVEVSDDSLTLPAPRHAAAQAENGRGLAMVDILAVDAGCDITVAGKTAWFEVGT